jgi:hypothetical protein
MSDPYQDLFNILRDTPRLPWECYRRLRPVLSTCAWLKPDQVIFVAKNDLVTENTVFVHMVLYTSLRAMTGQDRFPPTNTELACILLYQCDQTTKGPTIKDTYHL